MNEYAPEKTDAGQAAGQPGQVVMASPHINPADERLWATVAHVAGPIAALVSVGTLGWAVPLITYLYGKDRSAFLRQQSAEALNFQITLLIGYFAAVVVAALTFGIGVVLLPVVWVLSVVFGIIAAVAVNRGEPYRYPVNLRLVS